MRAVCFDMDGVLVDSEAYWIPQEREHILPRVVPDQDVDVSEITGKNYREVYDYLDANYEVAVSKAEHVRLFDEAAKTIFGEQADLLPGLADLLADLRARDVRLALVTSSAPSWIDVVFDRFDLHDAFDAVVSVDAFDGPGKPEPDVYLEAAKRLGVPPEETIAIEDSAFGMQAAASAGMHVIGFRQNGTPADGPADEIAADPEELRDRLLALTA